MNPTAFDAQLAKSDAVIDTRTLAVSSAPLEGPRERLCVPAMASLLVLLYGVDALFVAAPGAPWLELVLAGAILLLGREALHRGAQDLIYALRPTTESFLAFGGALAFSYSFVTALLATCGSLGTGHLLIQSVGGAVPSLYFTTAGAAVFAATVGPLLATRGTRTLWQRCAERRERLLRETGAPAASAGPDRHQTRAGGAERTIGERVAGYLAVGISLLATLAVVGGLLEAGGVDTVVMGALFALLLSALPSSVAIVPQALQTWGLARAASRDCLVQSGAALELLGAVRACCFNKLGILTVGCPQVVDILPTIPGTTEDDLLYLASVLEAQTEHPFREAILLRMSGAARTIPRVRGFSSVPGRGVRAVFQGQELVLGSVGYLEELGISCAGQSEQIDALAAEGKTVLVLARAGEPQGIITLVDERRPEAREAIAQLRRRGIWTALASGDGQGTVRAIAADLGFEEIHAGLDQSESFQVIERLRQRGRKVAMVGARVANATVLARADVAIAFGHGQERLAQAADVLVRGQDLRAVPRLIELARRVRVWTWMGLAALVAIQVAASAGVVSFLLRYSFLAADGEAALPLRASVRHFSYLPDLAAVVAALLPAGLIWLVRWTLERAERQQLGALAEAAASATSPGSSTTGSGDGTPAAPAL